MNAYETMITRAHAILDSTGNRSTYARAVLDGAQCWSGADLKSEARRWGSYVEQRRNAEAAVIKAGGNLIYVKNGRKVAAVYTGMDDYGSAVYDTDESVVVQRTAHRAA